MVQDERLAGHGRLCGLLRVCGPCRRAGDRLGEQGLRERRGGGEAA